MIYKLALGLVLGVCLLLNVGCNSTPKNVQQAVVLYHAGDYAGAEKLLQPDIVKKDESFVLNNCRYGSCALPAGDLAGAEQAFLAAYEVINGVNTNSGGRTLGATLVFEGVKVWKGEPFEQAMTHYYLGLTYLIKGDYENGRAAFKNSLFKLRDYAEDSKKNPEANQYQEYENKFAIGYLGLGLCYLRTGNVNTSDANFKLAVEARPDLAPVVEQLKNPATNVLIFVDYGTGPKRAGKGWYNEESAFGPTPQEAGPLPQIVATVDGKSLTTAPRYDLMDTLAMAQDKKWQDIDTIRKTKAVIGTGAMAAGVGVAAYGAQRGDTGTALAGVGVALLGGALVASSQADLRYWEMLPRTTYLIPAQLPPGEHAFVISAGGSTTATFTMPIKPQGDTVIYIRLR